MESVSAGGFSAEELDTARQERILILVETLTEFLSGDLELSALKSEIDGQNKRYRLWGFKGMNGMMFFNMLYNSSGESREQELADLLRTILLEPQDDSEIEAQIRTLEQYVEDLRADVDDLRSAPRLGSIPYFPTGDQATFDQNTRVGVFKSESFSALPAPIPLATRVPYGLRYTELELFRTAETTDDIL